MPLGKEEIREIAQALRAAELEGRPLPAPTLAYPDMTTADGYEVQVINIDERFSQGSRIVGRKIGLTNKPAQANVGADEPVMGCLFEEMLTPNGGGFDCSRLYQPKIEGELAFVLKDDLAGPGVTAVDVIRASAGVMAALEIVDTRIQDWKVRAADMAADNCCGFGFVLGSRLVPLDGINPAHLGFVLLRNGQVLGTGAGANTMSNPINAMVWLANKLGELGQSLRAGEVVISGAAVGPVPVSPGETYHLTIDRIDEVGCWFV